MAHVTEEVDTDEVGTDEVGTSRPSSDEASSTTRASSTLTAQAGTENAESEQSYTESPCRKISQEDAATLVQAKFRGLRVRKGGATQFFGAVLSKKAEARAVEKFKKLLAPARPPLPGTATPAGYVMHKRRPPSDASRLELLRDRLLDIGTHRVFMYLMVVWILALVVVSVAFGLFFAVGLLGDPTAFGLGKLLDYGCTENISETITCDPSTGTVTYPVANYWEEKSTQGLSALFTYSVLLASPWRIAIAVQLWCSKRCRGAGDGVDFYGRPNNMPFFHIPRHARAVIAVILNLNTLLQLTHQVLHIVWHDVVGYMSQPNGLFLLLTGPAAGVLTGPIAAGVQLYWESVLHHRAPGKFPPTPLAALIETRRRMRAGQTLASVRAAHRKERAETLAAAAMFTTSSSSSELPLDDGPAEVFAEPVAVQIDVDGSSQQAANDGSGRQAKSSMSRRAVAEDRTATPSMVDKHAPPALMNRAISGAL